MSIILQHTSPEPTTYCNEGKECIDQPEIPHSVYIWDERGPKPVPSASFLRVYNTVYRGSFYISFYIVAFFSFLLVPFIGLGAGGWEATIDLFVKPFLRPVGKITATLFGYSREPYFGYRDDQVAKIL
jgi:hypothetical protein